MNNFIKQIIEEKFESKAQQRFFYAQAGKGGKKGKKWAKWAKEFSKKTNFSKLPEKKEVDEIVDEKGNIKTKKTPLSVNSKGIVQKKTTDQVVKAGAGSMGTHGVHGTHTSLRYWAEADMSKALGYKETLKRDADYEDAEKHFEKDLGLSDDETKERMDQMGYDEELPDDKVRLVENPKKYIEEFIESILSKKSNNDDLVKNPKEGNITPIIKRQLNSLKTAMENNEISVEEITQYLKNNE